MATPAVQVEGMREFLSELRKMDTQWPKEMRLANKEAATVALPGVRRLIPVRSGRLKKSLRVLATQRRASVAVGSQKRVPYAHPINFGWPSRGIQPQEFMYRGLADSRPKIMKAYLAAVNRLVRRAFPD